MPTPRKKAAAKRKPPAKAEPEESAEDDRSLAPYSPRHRPLANSDLDQSATEKQRQKDLQDERDQHNERTQRPTGFKF